MRKIKLTQNEYATVDDKDYDWLSQYSWHLSSVGYAVRSVDGGSRKILMHRLIMGTPEGLDTDHINRDKLDNRRSNLRVCTHAENLKNKNPYKVYSTNKFGTGGVYWEGSRGGWVVRIQIRNERKYYGKYSTRKEAFKVAQLVRNGV